MPASRGIPAWHLATLPTMAYDEVLGERVRRVLGNDPDVGERKMFGGLAFMMAGNMACGVMGDDLLVRVGKDGYDAALALPFAGPMEMGDRTMGGFVVVDGEGVAEDDQLEAWVERGVAHAVSLPPK
jgi:TfoX/Sxy family transcriptional regulator of competence genes